MLENRPEDALDLLVLTVYSSSPTLVHEVHQGHFFRSLREVEGQRDLLPAQVQCLYPDFLIPSYNYAPLCESNFASL